MYSVSSTTQVGAYNFPKDFYPVETHWTYNGKLMLLGDISGTNETNKAIQTGLMKRTVMVEMTANGNDLKFIKQVDIPGISLQSAATADGESVRVLLADGPDYKIWDSLSNSLLSLGTRFPRNESTINLSFDGKLVAIGYHGEMTVINTKTGQRVFHLDQSRFKQGMPKPDYITAIWSPDGKPMALIGDEFTGSMR